MVSNYSQMESDTKPDFSESAENEQPAQSMSCEKEEELGGPKFSPPLYVQRYEEVTKILTDENVVKVIHNACVLFS